MPGKDETDPAKQPDPQESPSSSTGVEPNGPGGSQAGKGKRSGSPEDYREKEAGGDPGTEEDVMHGQDKV